MLARYVRWLMERALAPLLRTDHDPVAAPARHPSIVAPVRRSEAGERKLRNQQTDERSFDTPLAELTTHTRNATRVQGTEATSTSMPSPHRSRKRPSSCSLSPFGCSQ